MNTLESHIALDLRIDDIDSSRYDHISPSYKDMVLNDMVVKLMEKVYKAYKVSKDFNGVVRVLGSIVEQDIKKPALIESKNKQFVTLPGNLLYLLNSRSLVASTCAIVEELPYSEYVAVIEFDRKEIYPSYELTTNNGIVFSTSSIKGYQPVIGGEDFLLREMVLDYHTPDVEIYWEHYNTVYRKNCFVVVSKLPFTTLTDGAIKATFIEYKYTRIDSNDNVEVPNREFEAGEGELYHYLSRPFSIPTRRSPVTSLGKNLMYIHTSKFQIEEAIFSYIRKPKPYNFNINQSSELPEDTQKEVIDMAAQFIKAILNSPDYQVVALENKVLNN